MPRKELQMKNYYNLIKYEFCDKCEWHTVYGGWDKPISMNENHLHTVDIFNNLIINFFKL